jgi:hypothetical protein
MNDEDVNSDDLAKQIFVSTVLLTLAFAAAALATAIIGIF